MKDEGKTKGDFGETSSSSVETLSRAELINELVEMRQRVAELEAADTERKRAEETLFACHGSGGLPSAVGGVAHSQNLWYNIRACTKGHDGKASRGGEVF